MLNSNSKSPYPIQLDPYHNPCITRHFLPARSLQFSRNNSLSATSVASTTISTRRRRRYTTLSTGGHVVEIFPGDEKGERGKKRTLDLRDK